MLCGNCLIFCDGLIQCSSSVVWLYVFRCGRYEWRRNGTRGTFPLAGDGSGTIVITEPERQHEGVYQCFAWNGVGKAMSNTTRVVRAERAQFPEDPVRSEPATVGNKLRINCRSTQHGVPTPTIKQYTWRSDDNDNQWLLDQRVQIDDDGMYVCIHRRNFRGGVGLGVYRIPTFQAHGRKITATVPQHTLNIHL